jgi:hypothetical protein
MSDLTTIIGKLETINEELSDLAIDRLRESLQSGDAGAAEMEKRITRARRAVEKATGLLAGISIED